MAYFIAIWYANYRNVVHEEERSSIIDVKNLNQIEQNEIDQSWRGKTNNEKVNN